MGSQEWLAVAAALGVGLFHFLVAYARAQNEAKKEKADADIDAGEKFAEETKDTSLLEKTIRDNRDADTGRVP